jgi:hypothetical protein
VAKFAATDFTVTVNGTSLSTSLTSVDLTISADDKDVSTFGVTYRQHVGGLKQGQLKLNFLQDFAAGAGAAVESTLYPLLGTIAPTSGTVSATNPSYTVPCLVTQVQPLSASVGDVPTQQVTWMSSGTITKATS